MLLLMVAAFRTNVFGVSIKSTLVRHLAAAAVSDIHSKASNWIMPNKRLAFSAEATLLAKPGNKLDARKGLQISYQRITQTHRTVMSDIRE